jgi:hypothetical protein
MAARGTGAGRSASGASPQPAERGINGQLRGSFYYLAYALNHAPFDRAEGIWALAGFVVLVSIVVHGISVTPVMRLLERPPDRSA